MMQSFLDAKADITKDTLLRKVANKAQTDATMQLRPIGSYREMKSVRADARAIIIPTRREEMLSEKCYCAKEKGQLIRLISRAAIVRPVNFTVKAATNWPVHDCPVLNLCNKENENEALLTTQGHCAVHMNGGRLRGSQCIHRNTDTQQAVERVRTNEICY